VTGEIINSADHYACLPYIKRSRRSMRTISGPKQLFSDKEYIKPVNIFEYDHCNFPVEQVCLQFVLCAQCSQHEAVVCQQRVLSTAKPKGLKTINVLDFMVFPSGTNQSNWTNIRQGTSTWKGRLYVSLPDLSHWRDWDLYPLVAISQLYCSLQIDDRQWRYSCYPGMMLLCSRHDGAMNYWRDTCKKIIDRII